MLGHGRPGRTWLGRGRDGHQLGRRVRPVPGDHLSRWRPPRRCASPWVQPLVRGGHASAFLPRPDSEAGGRVGVGPGLYDVPTSEPHRRRPLLVPPRSHDPLPSRPGDEPHDWRLGASRVGPTASSDSSARSRTGFLACQAGHQAGEVADLAAIDRARPVRADAWSWGVTPRWAATFFAEVTRRTEQCLPSACCRMRVGRGGRSPAAWGATAAGFREAPIPARRRSRPTPPRRCGAPGRLLPAHTGASPVARRMAPIPERPSGVTGA